ncbi:MAG: hypothetical protein NUV46_03800 [Nanoarchaeota archaeon]|nr:hypothetical protein [Nanoarchaeota archaeon]
MNKENLERLIEKAEDFVIKKGKVKRNSHPNPKNSVSGVHPTNTIMEDRTYKSKGLILEYSSIDFGIPGKTESFSIYFKRPFRRKQLVLKKYCDGTIENYLPSSLIKDLEKILYKK